MAPILQGTGEVLDMTSAGLQTAGLSSRIPHRIHFLINRVSKLYRFTTVLYIYYVYYNYYYLYINSEQWYQWHVPSTFATVNTHANVFFVGAICWPNLGCESPRADAYPVIFTGGS